MTFSVIFLATIGSLFVVAFVTKRRFGVLGLALAAGAMLSNLWSVQVTPLVEQVGVTLMAPPLPSVVAAALTLAPAAILMVSGPTYKRGVQRVIGAAAFALLAGVFLLEPLGGVLVLEGVGRQVYEFLMDNQAFIVTAGLLFALFDLLFTKTPRRSRGKH